jgi:hypothetical protein
MSIVDNIKKRLALSQIRSDAKLVLREKQVFNMDDAKTIGIAFVFTGAEDFELIKKYVLYLREMKKKVKVIGYYREKEEPAVQYSKVDYDFFGKKSHSWYGKPTDHIVTNFIEEAYDIFIDLNLTDESVLSYVASCSHAHFKVGRFEEGNEVHDMQIDSPPDKGLKFYLRQIDTYLGKINKAGE